MTKRVCCFIGSGAMSSAIASGLLSSHVELFDEYRFVDHNQEQLERVRSRGDKRCQTFLGPELAVFPGESAVLVLAVKPQAATSAAQKLLPLLSPNHLVISVMAGVRLATLREMLGPHCRLVRVMPNAALTVGHGATAFAGHPSATKLDVQLTRSIFSASGYCTEVAESLLDAVTGVAGSGPAYVAVFIEALADGGVRMGLPRNLARELAVNTVIGSGKMLLSESYASPAVLKDLVASPGGTTIAAIASLEQNRFRYAVIEAVRAATTRAQELSKL